MNKNRVLYTNEITPEKLSGYIKTSELKLNHREKVNFIFNFIKKNHMSDEDVTVFNKILGDHQVLNKLVLVNDNSYRAYYIYYRTTSIWDNPQPNKSNNFTIVHYNPGSGHEWTEDVMNHIEAIDYLKRNHDKIFLSLCGTEGTVCYINHNELASDLLNY